MTTPDKGLMMAYLLLAASVQAGTRGCQARAIGRQEEAALTGPSWLSGKGGERKLSNAFVCIRTDQAPRIHGVLAL
jgi:hypothetical protein